MAELCAFLASDKSSYITGAHFEITGEANPIFLLYKQGLCGVLSASRCVNVVVSDLNYIPAHQ